MLRRPSSAVRRAALPGQFALRQPHLADDFRGAQIAVESLLSGGAKSAVHGAAHLTRDAQRAAIGFGDIDGLDPLDLVHSQHPFAGAILRHLLGHDLRNGDFRDLRELRAKLLLQIAHRGEIRGTTPVDPLHELTRTEWLRAETRRNERLVSAARAEGPVNSRDRSTLKVLLIRRYANAYAGRAQFHGRNTRFRVPPCPWRRNHARCSHRCWWPDPRVSFPCRPSWGPWRP